MSKDKLISIIIPTYNTGEYITEALDSIFKQTYKNIEVLVVDDGSTDNTGLLMEKYLKKDNFQYLKIKHSGLAATARNVGIKASNGSYIAFLDADDVWRPSKLAEQMKLFDDEVALVYSDGQFIGEDTKFSNLEKFYSGNIFEKLIWRNFITTSSVIVKKSVLDDVGVFSEDPGLRVGEDYDLWLRIAQKYNIKYSPNNLFYYRLNLSGLTKNKKRAYQNISNVYKKWLKQNITLRQKKLFLLAFAKNYLKIIYKSFD